MRLITGSILLALGCSLGFLSTAAIVAASDLTGSVLPVYDDVGGDFVAPSTLGREVRLSEFSDKAVLVYFGYTSCQDICPATLGHLRSLIGSLGDTADEVQVLFVTVDPEVDTAKHLEVYLARFDSRFIGLTGDPEKIDSIAALFMVKRENSHHMHVTTEYNRNETFTDRAILYSHSQQVFLLDKRGRTRALFFTGSPIEEMKKAIQTVLAEPVVPASPES